MIESLLWQLDDLQRRVVELASSAPARAADLRRPSPAVNHVRWLLGHSHWAKDFLLGDCLTGTTRRTTAWDPRFDFHSIKDDGALLPGLDEILAELQAVHGPLLEDLRGLDLSAPPARSLGKPFVDGHSLVVHCLRDGNYHCGQLSYLLRWLESGN